VSTVTKIEWTRGDTRHRLVILAALWERDLDEFGRSVYEPLRGRRSVTGGSGENFSLDFQDVGPVFDVIKGIDDGRVGGTPWKVMSSEERRES
jgi:hypothetical protein